MLCRGREDSRAWFSRTGGRRELLEDCRARPAVVFPCPLVTAPGVALCDMRAVRVPLAPACRGTAGSVHGELCDAR
eukprot:11855012-Alexandrium_andersonii.AAC.1